MPGEGHDILQDLHVVIGETDCRTSFVAAGLLRSASGINSNGGGSECVPNTLYGAAETLTVRQQEHNRRNSPRHAEHSEESLAEVVTHGAVSFGENIATHRIF